MDNELENLDSSTEELENDDSQNVEVEPQKEEYTEREKQYFARIKKLEAELEQKKEVKKEEKYDTELRLSPGDLLAITNAQVSPEDMDRVEWFAKSNGLALRDALAHPEMKAILALRKEQRDTAMATNVESVRRGTVKVTDDTLVQNASMGKLPTTDDDIERLVYAKSKRR